MTQPNMDGWRPDRLVGVCHACVHVRMVQLIGQRAQIFNS